MVDGHAPDRGPRELMVQLWYPALHTAGFRRAPYTTSRVAGSLETGLPLKAGTLGAVRPPARTGAPAVPGALPLVLLGHGRKGGRSWRPTPATSPIPICRTSPFRAA
ncbi:hypothetical protein ACFVX6_08670 [Streptomyces sp. NPDC058289]|uniref:hypothetical protein n=1 Tax=Streptomyces sp. NPDC058289 TaxID=3346425 RepID=UPI0036E963F2